MCVVRMPTAWGVDMMAVGSCLLLLTLPRPCLCPPQVMIDGELRIPYGNLLEINQVRPELQVVDPGDA